MDGSVRLEAIRSGAIAAGALVSAERHIPLHLAATIRARPILRSGRMGEDFSGDILDGRSSKRPGFSDTAPDGRKDEFLLGSLGNGASHLQVGQLRGCELDVDMRHVTKLAR
jgi:hypothetical protein